MLTKRKLLTGASALIVSVAMPPLDAAPLPDRNALNLIAQHVREGLLARPAEDRDYLLAYASRQAQTGIPDAAWLDSEKISGAVDCTLRVGFLALRDEATRDGYDFQLFRDGSLTVLGQNVISFLPLAPSEWHLEIFDALDLLAPHYLAA